MDTMRRFSVNFRGALLLIILAVLMLSGCGRKVWPQPQADQDTFAWEQVNGTSEEGCLRITGQLSGQSANLASVTIELEPNPISEACQSCPFQPSVSRTVDMGSPQLTQTQDTVTLRVCDLEPGQTYRWRLQGNNIYSALSPAASDVETTDIPR
ncbi:MAG: lipoprotein [Desulfohalobium sp.]